MVDLKVDFCSHEAAKYACEHWHYSKRMYVNKTVKFGVWENDKFVGVVVYGTGCQFIAKPYGLKNTEVCELVRVAMREHETPVSKILSITLKKLKKENPRLKLIVSFADSSKNHHGGIYQANNWLYVGSQEYHEYEVLGERVPPRTLHNRYGKGGQSISWLQKNVDPNARRVKNGIKHKYLYPLDRKLARQLQEIALPYPKKPADD